MADAPKNVLPRGTVAEPFGPKIKNTGLPGIPYLGKFLSGLFDETSSEATIVEPEKGISYHGKPGLDVSFAYHIFDQMKLKTKKKEVRTDKLLAPYKMLGSDGASYRTTPEIVDELENESKKMGYVIDLRPGTIRMKGGEECHGLHGKEYKEIILNGALDDDAFAYALSHEISHAELGVEATEDDVDAHSVNRLRKFGAGPGLLKRSYEIFQQSRN